MTDSAVTDSTAGAAGRLSPLHDLHVAGGASFTDFAGWQMPVSYGSDLAEHHAVRQAAGMFDISHMGELTVKGAQAGEFLDYALAGRISTVKLGQAKYSLLLAESGGIIDDLIAYRLADDEFLVVANAGNREAAFTALTERVAGFDATVTDDSDDFALIAVQGPKAIDILKQTDGLGDFATSLDELKYYWTTTATFRGTPVLVARTGYTGEDGVELYLAPHAAADLWRALLDAGQPHGLIPAGLASRDTLRLEAGMPLYGHELSLDIRPEQAGLGRVVVLAKEGPFVGREAIEAGPAEGSRVLVGLAAEGRRAARAGYAVYQGDTEVGTITSGALSPTLGHPIAMAYVDRDAAEPGTALEVDVRGTRIPATVVTMPFYTREKN